MTITDRDRRALLLLIPALAVIGLLYYASTPKNIPPVVNATSQVTTIPAAELRLAQMRQSVARIPGKDQALKQAAGQLATRERGLIVADTANQAQEQVLQIMRRIGSAQSPAVEFRGVELSAPTRFGDAYGQVTIALTFECRIDQLVNMLADLSARPELVATSDLRMTAGNPKQKTVTVRLAVSGIVPRKLVPEKKVGEL
jgi:hypothetical protein